ncbi:alpha/beta hydrolase [Glaciecola siphonariae]|uniref:Alpha/beta hydrolase n=1 Tax=Glaciecola siphonariae TaxID=521012 RepID=A0ABV9LXF4_9ALTE
MLNLHKNIITLSVFAAASISTANAADIVPVSFESHGQQIKGNLYLPDDYDAGQKLPTIIVSGAWTSVKEQMAGGYAEKIADQGYAALAFDFRGWGESNINTPVELQFAENPIAKTEDILAAVEFLLAREEVDSSKIATLGICASAGYAIDAAYQSENIATVMTVAPWLQDDAIVTQVYGDSKPTLLNLYEQAELTGIPVIIEAASDTNEQSLMYQASYYTDPNRGAIESYDNKFSTFSWGPWLNYDAIQTAERIEKPVLLVHSEAAAIPQGAKKFTELAGENAKLVMLDDVTQFDFYDNSDAMNASIEQIKLHIERVF